MAIVSSQRKQERDWEEWLGVSELLILIESTHSATLSCSLKRAGSGYRSFVDVEVVATLPSLTGPARPLRLSLLSHYPHPQHTTLPSLLLELLRRMDKRIGEEWYRQRELPLTPPAE